MKSIKELEERITYPQAWCHSGMEFIVGQRESCSMILGTLDN